MSLGAGLHRNGIHWGANSFFPWTRKKMGVPAWFWECPRVRVPNEQHRQRSGGLMTSGGGKVAVVQQEVHRRPGSTTTPLKPAIGMHPRGDSLRPQRKTCVGFSVEARSLARCDEHDRGDQRGDDVGVKHPGRQPNPRLFGLKGSTQIFQRGMPAELLVEFRCPVLLRAASGFRPSYAQAPHARKNVSTGTPTALSNGELPPVSTLKASF